MASPQPAASTSAPPAPAVRSFAALGLAPPLVRALAALAITVPTPVQAQALPLLLGGSSSAKGKAKGAAAAASLSAPRACDLIAGSPTGSGKTLAFALPILAALARDPVAGAAVVLTPTRELAAQLHEQLAAVAAGARQGLRVQLVQGGVDMMRQAHELAARPHIVVATPGRLADLLGNADAQVLGRCKFVVLDEADRLLTPTFSDALAAIFAALPPAALRQTLLFSATLTPEIEALATRPRGADERPLEVLKIEGSTTTPPQLEQLYIFVPSHMREPYLFHLLMHPPGFDDDDDDDDDSDSEGGSDAGSSLVPTIIFVSRVRTAALLARMLAELGVPCLALHSSLSQAARAENLTAFRAGKVPLLITTDVGSRGLDVPEVQLVVNWDLPRDWRDYVHRVGRTARAGREGTAVSFVGERDVELLKGIEEAISGFLEQSVSRCNVRTLMHFLADVTMTEHEMPEEEVLERLNAVSTAKRVAAMELHDTHFGERQEAHKKKAAAALGASADAQRRKSKKKAASSEKQRKE
ncbi:DEAD-domain-containing protein [Tilletiopsis washingtonensis]|uniref:DEAD-domain-containing protein n=1 Tax=Tilletiopsis washingtonensis TaxID=58919 RepID=A0A316Z4C6_9BASI|nr:DEAD-domain-containing protein [Tilletiopsis washingtonensis]PWN95818.1 DEAD-domain-containing protein [Tilletiopsis washingtonensis]